MCMYLESIVFSLLLAQGIVERVINVRYYYYNTQTYTNTTHTHTHEHIHTRARAQIYVFGVRHVSRLYLMIVTCICFYAKMLV